MISDSAANNSPFYPIHGTLFKYHFPVLVVSLFIQRSANNKVQSNRRRLYSANTCTKFGQNSAS